VRAIVLREVGGELALEDVPEPEGEAVDVRAAGVNFADVLVRRGRYPQMPDLPHVLGGEVAGELDGRRVAALTRAGAYAERVAVDPHWVFELPSGAGFAEGAALLTTYLTAYIPLVRQGLVSDGSSVLVHAGAGGVGTAAIQLAKHLGAQVVATASTERKREFARSVGADDARGYDDLDDIRVDVVVDPVGGELFARSLLLLNPSGWIVAVGYAGGAWEDVNPALIVGRNVGVKGVFLGRLMQLAPVFVRDCGLEVVAMWERGEIAPVVGARFPLERAADAHALMEARENVGKVVLEP
jgi:NADPH2:quinone reductase